MGDEAYNALSDEEKKNHCDILTLLMQGNGQAVLLLETLLTKASDSSNSTWLDRFKETSLEKLTEAVKNENPNMTPSELNAELDKRYSDDAKRILDKWDAFNEILMNYDNAVQKLKKAADEKVDEKKLNLSENPTKAEINEALTEMAKSESAIVRGGLAAEDIAAHDYLAKVEYGDGTMLEFFERDKSEFDDTENIRELYPIVDSLTGGQLAGLDFLSIKDMVVMALTDENGFQKIKTENLKPASVYQDVNREIYEKGGVALTDAAMRARATAQEAVPTSGLSTLGTVLWISTALSGVAVAVSVKAFVDSTSAAPLLKAEELQDTINYYSEMEAKYGDNFTNEAERDYTDSLLQQEELLKSPEYKSALLKSNVCKYLAAGFTVLGAVLAGISIYTTITEMMAYYKVDFVPIPKYIVDRADITATNPKGETVMIKNQTAYYKSVLCNRTDGSSNLEKKNHEILKDRNDLNGDVGMQWLSLYSVKYVNGMPILADSLKIKTGSGDAPEGYTTGIHRFGENNAFNLTSKLYCYNDPYDGTYVYFKNDTATVKDLSTTGSAFSGGTFAIGAVIGLIPGGVVTFAVMTMIAKKKKKKEQAKA